MLTVAKLFVIVSVGLVACGFIAAVMTAGRRGRRTGRAPSSVSGDKDVPVLPPHRPAALPVPDAAKTVGASAARASNAGPRGIRPAQFPCCPYDKQRNVPGYQQVIFWDRGANSYRCSRGHRFGSNGKPL